MKKRSKVFLCKAVLMLMTAAVFCPLSAFAANSVDVENHGSIGAVDIALSYEVDGDTTAILPNEQLPLKSSVTNLAEPAWIRVKIEYPVYENAEVLEHLEEEKLTELNDDRITFTGDFWKKIGSYYYWTKPVAMGETVDFTESILFPVDWDNRLIGSKFGIYLTAEAVQETNFTPDFDSDDPWHGTVIEAYDAIDYKDGSESSNHFSVRYEGGSNGMVQTGDNFFSNWDVAMPGDVLKGEAKISNNMELPVKMFFSMKSDADEKEKQLLEKLSLKIWHGQDLIYDGTLAKGLSEILLKEYVPGESVTFSYELTVPSSITNEYAESDFHTLWIFRAEEIPPEPVKTGDPRVIVYGIGITTSIGICSGAGYYFLRRRKI